MIKWSYLPGLVKKTKALISSIYNEHPHGEVELEELAFQSSYRNTPGQYSCSIPNAATAELKAELRADARKRKSGVG